MTVTSLDCWRKYGNPYKHPNMQMYYTPQRILADNPRMPVRIYMNADLHAPLNRVLDELAYRKLLGEIKSFGGCHNIRDIRGMPGVKSLHSWGIALDWNVADNPLGWTAEQAKRAGLTPFTDNFVAVWEKFGWEAGIRWERADGMHFQIARLP